MELEEKIEQYDVLTMMMRSASGSSEGEANGEETHGGNISTPTTTTTPTSVGRMSSLVAGKDFVAPTFARYIILILLNIYLNILFNTLYTFSFFVFFFNIVLTFWGF